MGEMTRASIVETVSINCDDFADAFLTCSTCLRPFDQTERRAKLLSCSHSVCLLCLGKIARLAEAEHAGFIRCPICRAMHQVPRGGVAELPPSCLVNQLMDLLARERKCILLPSCDQHGNDALHFCETCDKVFCKLCHLTPDCTEHKTVAYQSAGTRMHEMLLMKTDECQRNLARATDNCQTEQERLDANVDKMLDQINTSFLNLSTMLDERRADVINQVRRLRDDKRRVLQEQLSAIQNERIRVDQIAASQMDVQTRAVQLKASQVACEQLVEPRENAYLKYDSATEDVLRQIRRALAQYGTLSVSRTFPPLCTALAINGCARYVRSSVLVSTFDANGIARTSGADPISAKLVLNNASLPVTIDDRDDGTYEISFRAIDIGDYQLDVRIFDRPIKNMPLKLTVTEHHSPVAQIGSLGAQEHQLCQPTKVLAASTDGQSMYILDTGNCRLQHISVEGVVVHSYKCAILCGQSAVSMALVHRPSCTSILVLNWRQKKIGEIDSVTGNNLRTISFSEFVEPIDLCVDSQGRMIVADTGANKIFVFDDQAKPLFSFAVTHTWPKSPERTRTSVLRERQTQVDSRSVTALGVGVNDDILVAFANELLVFDCIGKLTRTILLADAAIIGGIVVDRLGARILCTVTDQQRNTYCTVLGYKGDHRFKIDSYGCKMKRPSGICLTVDGEHCLIADLGNHCVKQFRFA